MSGRPASNQTSLGLFVAPYGNGVWPFNDAWLRTSLEEARRQAPRNGASILDSARELGIRDAQDTSPRGIQCSRLLASFGQ